MQSIPNALHCLSPTYLAAGFLLSIMGTLVPIFLFCKILLPAELMRMILRLNEFSSKKIYGNCSLPWALRVLWLYKDPRSCFLLCILYHCYWKLQILKKRKVQQAKIKSKLVFIIKSLLFLLIELSCSNSSNPDNIISTLCKCDLHIMQSNVIQIKYCLWSRKKELT